jgi:hypothetical protein
MPTVQIELDRPHDGQQRVIGEAKRFNVLQCGRRFGKTTMGLNRLIETALCGHPTGWFAPSYKLLADVWREAKRTLSPIQPTLNEQEKRIELVTRGVIEFWSLDQPDAGRGRKYKRVVIDEAGIVRNLDQAWQEAIRPTLADLKGDAWFLGTPKGHNFFHRLYAKGQAGEKDWASWRMPTTANPYIDPEEVEAARRDMPPSAFDQEFLGVPAADGGNPFGMDAINECVAPQSSQPAVVFGVDLAKSEDWTVVCGLDNFGAVCVLERWQSDWRQTRSRVLTAVGEIDTLADSTGVGDPIVEDLHRERRGIDGFKFTSTSKQQLMEGLAAAIHKREIRFPDGWLRNELDSFEYEYRPGGGVRYSAPEGLHDDGVVALALANKAWQDRKAGIGAAWDRDDLEIVFGRKKQREPTPYEVLMSKLKRN